MKVTWVLLVVVGVVSADVGLGYHYKVPQSTYGIPSYQFGGNSGQYSTAYSGNSGLGAHSLSGYQSGLQSLPTYSLGYSGGNGYQSGGVQSASGLGSGYYQSSGSSGSGNLVQPIFHYAGNSGLGTGFQSQYQSSSQYQAAEKYQHHYDIQQQPAKVFKHFYVHAAPEEPEPPKPRTPIVLPPAQKHYKIIFVKTPSEHHRSQTIVPVQPQNEEKTIVYVLVKKPEDQQEVVVPKIEQKPPSKPEVYFIKYKNKEDSQAVISNIVKDYNQGQPLTIVNSGVGDGSFNTASGFGTVQYDAPVQNEVTANAQTFGVSGNQGSGFASTQGSGFSTTQGTGFGSSQGSGFGSSQGSGFGSSQGSSGFSSSQGSGFGSSQGSGFGSSQGSVYSLSSANSGSDLNEANIVSTVASPVTISSTVSSLDYDGASAIATSQGVPHETYGPPKFRVN
ncbi:uncharacterized protein LOC142986226 [Anticarsia gemmatalis]|uniref:uncharacterized protein LOC142986226 n=1 Tax=Anticarsia gemmatalis TaxID=129554 RepID=UPI003F7601C5